jgi:hypothetical protein
MSSLDANALTWTGLLGQWVQFAQASMALPDDADGPAWRASVGAVINLQAVTFALADLDRLPPDEQALAVDKAEILIRDSEARIDAAWRGAGAPESLREIVRDANAALESVRARLAARG